MAPSVCDDSQLAAENMTYAQCLSRRGGVIDSSGLESTSVTDQATLQSLNPGWREIQGPDAYAFTVESALHLHGGAENDVTMLEIVATDGPNHTTSQLALGNQSVLLDTLFDTKRITRRSFGLDAGSTSIARPREGSIVLGGYDSSAIDGQFIEYPMTYPGTLHDRVCPLQVTIKQLSLKQPGMSDIVWFNEEWTLPACIEPYDNLFRLPGTLINNSLVPTMEKILKSQPTKSQSDSTFWVNEPGLVFPTNGTNLFNGSLVVTLDQNFTVEIPGYEFVRPLRGLASNGSLVIDDRFTEVQVFHAAEPLSAAVLGKVFLSQVYLHVDYDRKVLELANINTESNGVFPVVDGAEASCSSKLKRLGGSTIGIIIIGIVLALLLVGLGYCLLMWWKRRHAKQPRDKSALHSRGLRDKDLPEVDEVGRKPSLISPVSTQNITADSGIARVQSPISDLHEQSPSALHRETVEFSASRQPRAGELQGTSVIGELQANSSPNLPRRFPPDSTGITGDDSVNSPRLRNMSEVSGVSSEHGRLNQL